MKLKTISKLILVSVLGFSVSGCWLSFGREDPTIIYRTQYQALNLPSEVTEDCPEWVNPPRSLLPIGPEEERIMDERDQVEAADWARMIAVRYQICERKPGQVREAQQLINDSVERLNEAARNADEADKDGR